MLEPTREELVYRALRSAAGKGGFAEDELRSIDGLIRRVRARAIASVAEMAERAARQAFPSHATDLLPYYERLLGLTDDPDLSEDERRAAAAALYALQLAGDIPSLRAALRIIDSRFEVITAAWSTSTTTVAGRAFEDLAGDAPFGGGRESTALPNFAGALVVYVLFELGSGLLASIPGGAGEDLIVGTPNAAERRKMALARRLLHDVLPATNDLQIVTHRGFTLDVSPLDLTSFGA
jgi:hypothetical protein